MYCKNCGKELNDHAVVCPNCGVQVAQVNIQPNKKPVCELAIIGFVLSFFSSIAGLICSIIAYKKCKNENLDGGTYALAGIIISAVSLAISVVSIFIIFSFYGIMFLSLSTAVYY